VDDHFESLAALRTEIAHLQQEVLALREALRCAEERAAIAQKDLH
jgi:outer membrane protein TolC